MLGGYPRNCFQLAEAPAYVFIAGGMGITPILPMVRDCAENQAQWRAHFLGRSLETMPFADELTQIDPARVTLHVSSAGDRIDLTALCAELENGTAVYACGPERLISGLEDLHAQSGNRWSLHVERFSPRVLESRSELEIVAARSGVTFRVSEGQTILEALKLHGVKVDSTCRSGVCGTCEVPVLEGIVDHRDQVLSADEKAEGKTTMTCLSWGISPRLVLDV